MPKAATKKKPVAPVAPAPPPEVKVELIAPVVPVSPGLPVIYDKLAITEFSTTSPKGPLTVERIRKVLGWITEKEYQDREMEKNPGTTAEVWEFKDNYHCKNVAGEKVRCEYNAHNRPFDEGWSEELDHTVLVGQWAGPFTFPGETVNGETIRISKYGRVTSGQHCMTACMIADEKLQKARKELGTEAADQKYPTWKGQAHVFIETIVITGMSEDPRVLMTVDYVKPRSAADVFYTSDVFKSSASIERKELCRMLSQAVDLLWTRTDTQGYRTHPEVVAFLERHKSLLKCVTHLFSENSTSGGRKIARQRLTAGQCAAIEYIQASSGPETDGDGYRNEEPAPSEKNLDFSYEDQAEAFWTLLATGQDFLPVRKALGLLIDSSTDSENNIGLGGRANEKFAILSKAWEVWRDHVGDSSPFSLADLEPDGCLSLSYTDIDDRGNALPEGQIKLLDTIDFGGIDCPEAGGKKHGSIAPPMPAPPTPEEIERLTAEALERRKHQK